MFSDKMDSFYFVHLDERIMGYTEAHKFIDPVTYLFRTRYFKNQTANSLILTADPRRLPTDACRGIARDDRTCPSGNRQALRAKKQECYAQELSHATFG
jgi:hypothetical protein